MAIELTWDGNQAISIGGEYVFSGFPPALMGSGDDLYVLYLTPANVLSQLTYGAKGWNSSGPVSIGGTAPSCQNTPAMALLDSTLYMAYVDTSNSKQPGYGSLAVAAYSGSGATWNLLSGSGAPVAQVAGLSMVPYNGQLWIYYRNDSAMCGAVASPTGGTGTIDWVTADSILSAQSHNGPAAALAYFPEGETAAAPLVVYTGTSQDNLDYFYYDPTTKKYEGNTSITVVWLHLFRSTPQSNRPPCMVSIPPIGNSGPVTLVLFKGLKSKNIDLLAWQNGRWQGNLPISIISNHTGGPQIQPKTDIGVGAAFFGGKIMMVFPSSNSESGQELYWASVTKKVGAGESS